MVTEDTFVMIVKMDISGTIRTELALPAISIIALSVKM